MYIPDWANHRVVRWARGASAGVVVAGGHDEGARLDQLNGPAGVAVAALFSFPPLSGGPMPAVLPGLAASLLATVIVSLGYPPKCD